MDNLNNYLQKLKPIIEAEGGTVEEAIYSLFKFHKVDQITNQGSLYYRLNQALSSSEMAGGKTVPTDQKMGRYNKAINPPNPELQGFDLDKTGSGKLNQAAPRGIRNNNPGNIVSGDFATKQGATGTDGTFATFDTPEQGIKAMKSLLENYQKKGLDTVSDMLNRWAPGADDNVDSYIRSVAKEMGIDPDEPFLFEGALAEKMINAMIRHENGVNPYEKAQDK